jgi:hypothetical protein
VACVPASPREGGPADVPSTPEQQVAVLHTCCWLLCSHRQARHSPTGHCSCALCLNHPVHGVCYMVRRLQHRQRSHLVSRKTLLCATCL